MTPTITKLVDAVVDAINAGGFGVTAAASWRGARSLAELETLRVDVGLERIEAEAETGATTELERLVAVVVRQRVPESSDDAIGAVVQMAETLGRFLLNGELAVDATPVAMTIDPPLDEDTLAEHGVAESIAVVRYLILGG